MTLSRLLVVTSVLCLTPMLGTVIGGSNGIAGIGVSTAAGQDYEHPAQAEMERQRREREAAELRRRRQECLGKTAPDAARGGRYRWSNNRCIHVPAPPLPPPPPPGTATPPEVVEQAEGFFKEYPGTIGPDCSRSQRDTCSRGFAPDAPPRRECIICFTIWTR